MLDGACAGRDAAAVAHEPDGLVAQGEADEDAVDRVLQLTGDAVVVLGRDDQERVALGDLLVPRLHDRIGVRRVGEVSDRAHVLLEERELPVAQVEQLDLELAVALRAVEDPGEHAIGGSRRACASDNDLQLVHGRLLHGLDR